MRQIVFPVGFFESSGAITSREHYDFYEIDPDFFEGTILDSNCVTIAWTKWETYRKKGWTKIPPADFGAGIPDEEKHTEIYEEYRISVDNGETPQGIYEYQLYLAEDGSGKLLLSNGVLLSFETGSLNKCFSVDLETLFEDFYTKNGYRDSS